MRLQSAAVGSAGAHGAHDHDGPRSTVRWVPLTPTIGVVLDGVDLARRDAGVIAEIETALVEHHVVFFRDQRLDDRTQRDLAAHFGPVQRFPYGAPADEAVPEVHVIATGGEAGRVGNADTWHTDATFLPAPPMGSILRAVELPPCGGDTLFASTEAAYAALSSRLQRMLDGMTATHDAAASRAHRRRQDDFPPVSHPVVRTHPVSGRKSLFVNRIFTVRLDGLTDRENDALLPFLCDHVQSPEFQCRFAWQPGSVAFWDNRCTQHYAVADYTARRVMHRVVIDGDVPR
jgi:taurine dioxygenase